MMLLRGAFRDVASEELVTRCNVSAELSEKEHCTSNLAQMDQFKWSDVIPVLSSALTWLLYHLVP